MLGITKVFLCVCDLKTYYTWGLCFLQPVRHRVLSIQESFWIAGEQSLWRFGSLPWRLTRVIGRGLGVLSSRGTRWRCSLLSWISVSLTRRTVVTATRTGLTNHCLPRATGSILFFPLLTTLCCEDIACFPYLIVFTEYLLVVIGFIPSSFMITTA